jgi:hypothetical protein
MCGSRSRIDLADVAARESGGERLEREALVLAGELVGGVDLDVAARAQRRLVGAAHHRGHRALARVALDLHLSLSLLAKVPSTSLALLAVSQNARTREDKAGLQLNRFALRSSHVDV